MDEQKQNQWDVFHHEPKVCLVKILIGVSASKHDNCKSGATHFTYSSILFTTASENGGALY
jgi:hypothetical protein